MKILNLFLLFLSIHGLAFAKIFDFKDSKGINTIIFQLDALLESINGSAGGVSGNVSFDPDKPQVTKGSIILDADTLRVDNSSLQEHMHGKEWLDVEKFPKIEFSLSGLKNVRRDGSSIKADANGKMSIRNVTLKMSVPVELSYLPGMLEKRNKVPGDLLIVRAKFTVNRDDFVIRPGEYLDKVANEIEISINLAGACPIK